MTIKAGTSSKSLRNISTFVVITVVEEEIRRSSIKKCQGCIGRGTWMVDRLNKHRNIIQETVCVQCETRGHSEFF